MEPCGLCMCPSPLCAFLLRKGKGAGSTLQIDGRVSRCPNFIGKLFYSAASTERTNSPCTNVSVICPLCPSTSAAVWKYNMNTHLARVHPSTNSSDFQKGYVISNSERVAPQNTLGEAGLRFTSRYQAQCCLESSYNFRDA